MTTVQCVTTRVWVCPRLGADQVVVGSGPAADQVVVGSGPAADRVNVRRDPSAA